MRLWAILLPVAAVTLVGIPMQALALALRLPARRAIPRLYYRIVLALIGVRVRVVGEFAAGRPLLIVANHVSWLDIPVLGARMPLAFVAKSEVGTWPGIGLLARLARTVFVDRQRRSDTARVTRAMAERMGEGDPVVLFAEGTSSEGVRVLPFRSALLGATQAAVAGDTPVTVQPLAIAYIRQDGLPLLSRERHRIAWFGDMELAPHLAALLRRGAIDVELRVGPPLAGATRKEIAVAAEQSVRDLLQAAPRR
ncbi:lysophospholipid acyltransferase family protein [Ancylobacter terrae]|uniref:lysophospholipid acyltransferase family protein n=1 Tax=Ancylobacter sp. sgz301288 TaxID=3342077 RepID=UPI00385AC106